MGRHGRRPAWLNNKLPAELFPTGKGRTWKSESRAEPPRRNTQPSLQCTVTELKEHLEVHQQQKEGQGQRKHGSAGEGTKRPSDKAHGKGRGSQCCFFFFSSWFSLVRSVFWPPRYLSLAAEPVGTKRYLRYPSLSFLCRAPFLPTLSEKGTNPCWEGGPFVLLWAAACMSDLISLGDVGNFTKAKQRFAHKPRAVESALEVRLPSSRCLSMVIVCLTPLGTKTLPPPIWGQHHCEALHCSAVVFSRELWFSLVPYKQGCSGLPVPKRQPTVVYRAQVGPRPKPSWIFPTCHRSWQGSLCARHCRSGPHLV